MANCVFISGVNLGRHALQAIFDSEPYKRGDAQVSAIFSLSEERAKSTVGFRPFDDLAQSHGAPLYKVQKLCTQENIELLKEHEPDMIFIIGWSELANAEILDLPKTIRGAQERHSKKGYGCIGMHPTLLPEGRGRAPIPWAIIKGLSRSGVTMFYLEEGADEGDIIAQREFAINFDDDAQSVYDKVAQLHYQIVAEKFPALVRGNAARIPQSELAKMRGIKPSYWQKRRPKDGVINWNKTAIEIFNWIRALTRPYPGAFTYYDSQKVVIWKAALFQHGGELGAPGQILGVDGDALLVSCKQGAVQIQKVQFEGGEEATGREFAFANKLSLGDRFMQKGSA